MSKTGRKFLRQFKKLFNEFSESNGMGIKTENAADGERYMFAGKEAKTANIEKLSEAEKMLEKGVYSETVRKKTGWHKGYEGKWKFEIDDSIIQWYLADIGMKTSYEYSGIKLSDIMSHDALFKAYPQLKDVTVYVNPSMENGVQVYAGSTTGIAIKTLDNSLMTKWIILHEAQHIIQNMEGFATGASKYQYHQLEWGNAQYEAFNKCRDIRRKLYAVLKRNGIEFDKSDMDSDYEMYYGEADKVLNDCYFDLQSLAYKNKRTSHLIDDYYDNLQVIHRTTPDGQYHATAGEIEAYDTQARMDMTSEQRKNTRPNIDRADAVFADGSGVSAYLEGWSSNGEEIYTTSKDTLRLSIPERIKSFKNKYLSEYRGRTAKFVRNGHVCYAELEMTSNVAGKFTHESKSDSSGIKAKIRMLSDGNMFEIIENTKYKNSAPEKGKKTAAHNDVKYWDYYIKSIFVDGLGV